MPRKHVHSGGSQPSQNEVVTKLTAPYEAVMPRTASTSIAQFRSAFQDDDACLEHVFKVRFGSSLCCPSCGSPTHWYHGKGKRYFASSCCGGRQVFPLAGTLMANTIIPPLKWFRALLYFSNFNSGITTRFLSVHLGLSHKAAARMASRIRQHLAAIDGSITFGGPGKTVFIDEAVIKKIVRTDGRRASSMQLLILSDTESIRAIPFEGKMGGRAMRQIQCATHPESVFEIRSKNIFRKLTQYRKLGKLYENRISISQDNNHKEYYLMSVFSIAMKNFILAPHLKISQKYLPSYLSHFQFLYNRRNSGNSVFAQSISNFHNINSV